MRRKPCGASPEGDLNASSRGREARPPCGIFAPIGAGGMGEVYKPRDPRLGRDVDIKVSPARFSERFEPADTP